jgi:hypothetical protein
VHSAGQSWGNGCLFRKDTVPWDPDQVGIAGIEEVELVRKIGGGPTTLALYFLQELRWLLVG